MQEVLNDVSKQIRTFEYDPVKGKFRSWLGTITVNKIKKFWKVETSSRINTCRIEPDWDAGAPDSHWIEIYSEQILDEAIKKVRPYFEDVSWQCFVGTWVEHANPSDVAQSLGVSIQSVYVNKSRVLKRLEQEVRFLSEDLACNGRFEGGEDGTREW